MKDVSILIVHHSTPGLLRQTLRGIFSCAHEVSFEVIVVDNNPNVRVHKMIQKEFPQVKVVMSEKNIGFGNGMNLAMEHAKGRYLFVFNPDITMIESVLGELVHYMDKHADVGMVGPKLLNPDGSLQHSCYRFMKPEVIFYRRIPFIGKLPFARRAVDHYQMKEWDHSSERDIDYLLGAAMFTRREAMEDVGGFDPNFFVYFEDQDLCRRFWKNAWRVVYLPTVELVHYHRRETAKGNVFTQLTNPLTRIQMQSAIYYYKKYRGETSPTE